MKKLFVILFLSVFASVSYAENGFEAAPCATSTDEGFNIWKKDGAEFRFGYSFGNLDRGRLYGGSIDSRWGASFAFMRNIYVHRKPIGNFLKFGIQIGSQLNYLNFEKGHGSLKDIMNGEGGEGGEGDIADPALGKHQIVAGIAVGPTATFAPFCNSDSKNLARLKFRLYFNAVPSYSAIVTSNSDESELHGAFACMFAGGFNILWRKLNVGFQYKGGRARYKDLVENIEEDETGGYIQGKNPRFATNIYTVSIGVVF